MSDFKKLSFYDEDDVSKKLGSYNEHLIYADHTRALLPSTIGDVHEIRDACVRPNVYVVRWETATENNYYTQKRSGILGVFMTEYDAVHALEAMEVPCWHRANSAFWRLYKVGANEEKGVAQPATKDGVEWELYGPTGLLVDGGVYDEPSFFIEEHKLDELSPWTTEVWI